MQQMLITIDKNSAVSNGVLRCQSTRLLLFYSVLAGTNNQYNVTQSIILFYSRMILPVYSKSTVGLCPVTPLRKMYSESWLLKTPN